MRIGLDITVLHDFQKTGVGVYTFNLINSLLKIDRTDQFFLFGVGNLTTFKYLNSLPFLKQANVTHKILKIPSKLFRVSFNLWQRLNCPKIDQVFPGLDLYHSFNYYLPPQGGGRVFATVYDLTPITHPQWHHPKTVEMERIRLERINKYADVVIAISESTKRDFLKLYPGKRVEVIYPGVGEQFRKAISEDDIKRVLTKYNLQPGYFLSVATKEPRKNLETLIKAYLQLSHPEFISGSGSRIKSGMTMEGVTVPQLVLVGKFGWGEDNLSRLIKDNKQIKVLGFVPDTDLPALYNQSLCLVYPSLYEGFGLPVLEAIYSKTAVITSNNSSLPEVVGGSSLLVDPGSVDDLKEAMQKLSSDNKLRRSLIAKGIIQAGKFSWEDSSKKLLEIYHEFS